MTAYDAVVVGAGPSGAATAAHLARGGARVLICDPSHFPRDKACGGGLTPRGTAALDRLGIELASDEAIRVGGLEMVGHGRSVSTAFPATTRWPSHGVVARRSTLDAKILQAALDAGAEFRAGVRAIGPLFEDGICRGVRTKSDSLPPEDVHATWTIAADGATSVTARAAGLAPTTTSASGGGFWYAALRGYFGPVAPRTHDGEAVLEFYPLRTPSGRWLPAYGWVFPLPDGSANVGVDIPHTPRLGACPPLRQAYDAFIERMRRERPGFDGAIEEAPPVGALLPEAMLGFRAAAPGLLCVGDAAGMITPYSGEGILYALESAELAAGCIASDKRPSEVVARYGAGLRDGYRFQLSSALAIMKAMRKAPLAAAAAAIGFRSARALRAGVRVMAYLIEDDATTSSTVSKGYRLVRKIAMRDLPSPS